MPVAGKRLANGLNLVRIESYIQEIVLGAVLVLAVVADQFRLRFLGQFKAD